MSYKDEDSLFGSWAGLVVYLPVTIILYPPIHNNSLSSIILFSVTASITLILMINVTRLEVKLRRKQ